LVKFYSILLYKSHILWKSYCAAFSEASSLNILSAQSNINFANAKKKIVKSIKRKNYSLILKR
jgi:hypothetical protein